MCIVSVTGLNKRYSAFELKDVTFAVKAGTITGFIGRNGAGKTTTIKSMLGLIHPDQGEITYFGMPLAGNENEIKQRIGYSTGTISWYPRKTIHDTVDIVRRFYDQWNEAEYQRYLALFELDEHKTPMELSEGMKVKLNLLLALSHKAEVLILDEPTSGLDPFSREELLDVFLKLKDQGTAIFYSTHIISDIEKCADDIVYISKGTIVAAMTRMDFTNQYSADNETLEETILRMERSDSHD